MSYGGGVGRIEGGGSSKHLLEIEVVGLKRRLWAAESKQECRRWVSIARNLESFLSSSSSPFIS